MMTTGTAQDRLLAGPTGSDPQPRVAAFTGLGCVLVGLVTAGVGLVVSGPGAAVGAAIGAALAGGIFVVGALAVHVSARVLPKLSLVVALLTYVCQVMTAMLVFAGLTSSGMLDDGTVSGAWLGATLAGCALLWVGVQIRVAATARIPLYDLPDAGAR